MPNAQEIVDTRFPEDPKVINEQLNRVHPNQPTNGDIEFSIISPNAVEPEAFATGATVDQTVTPANPTPPTNIQYWGETPPNSTEMVGSFELDQNTYIAEDDPRRAEAPEETKEQDEARRPRVREFQGNYETVPDVVDTGGHEVERLVLEDPTKFAPNLGGMPHEAAGTEDVMTIEQTPPDGEPVQTPVAVSAGVVEYTRVPNATHPSNPDAVPPEGGGGTDPETPALDLTDIDPDSAVVSTTFTLTVTGTGFTDASVVLVNDVAQTTTFVSDTSLTAEVTADGTPATVDVEVQDGAALSDALTLDYVAAERDESGEGQERKTKRKPQRKPSRKPAKKSGGKGKGRGKG